MGSLRETNETKYHKYASILRAALYHVIQTSTQKAPQKLYRGISLPRDVANKYRRGNFKNFEQSRQFESFSQDFRAAKRFANGSHNEPTNGNVPFLLRFDVESSDLQLAYIERYGIKDETEWLALPGMRFNVKDHSDSAISGFV